MSHTLEGRAGLFSSTPSAWGLTTSRIAVATLSFAHGLWKLGAWGGPGYTANMRFFTETLHLPSAIAVLVVVDLAAHDR